jgi:hypothetical protein
MVFSNFKIKDNKRHWTQSLTFHNDGCNSDYDDDVNDCDDEFEYACKNVKFSTRRCYKEEDGFACDLRERKYYQNA